MAREESSSDEEMESKLILLNGETTMNGDFVKLYAKKGVYYYGRLTGQTIEDGEALACVRWLYKRKEAGKLVGRPAMKHFLASNPLPPALEPFEDRELFRCSQHRDAVSIDAIVSKVAVVTVEQFEQLVKEGLLSPSTASADRVFFMRSRLVLHKKKKTKGFFSLSTRVSPLSKEEMAANDELARRFIAEQKDGKARGEEGEKGQRSSKGEGRRVDEERDEEEEKSESEEDEGEEREEEEDEDSNDAVSEIEEDEEEEEEERGEVEKGEKRKEEREEREKQREGGPTKAVEKDETATGKEKETSREEEGQEGSRWSNEKKRQAEQPFTAETQRKRQRKKIIEVETDSEEEENEGKEEEKREEKAKGEQRREVGGKRSKETRKREKDGPLSLDDLQYSESDGEEGGSSSKRVPSRSAKQRTLTGLDGEEAEEGSGREKGDRAKSTTALSKGKRDEQNKSRQQQQTVKESVQTGREGEGERRSSTARQSESREKERFIPFATEDAFERDMAEVEEGEGDGYEREERREEGQQREEEEEYRRRNEKIVITSTTSRRVSRAMIPESPSLFPITSPAASLRTSRFGTRRTALSVLEGRSPAFEPVQFMDFDSFVEGMREAAAFLTPFPALVISSEAIQRASSAYKLFELSHASPPSSTSSSISLMKDGRRTKAKSGRKGGREEEERGVEDDEGKNERARKQKGEKKDDKRSKGGEDDREKEEAEKKHRTFLSQFYEIEDQIDKSLFWKAIPPFLRRPDLEASALEAMAHYFALCGLLSCYQLVEDGDVGFLLSPAKHHRKGGPGNLNIELSGLAIARLRGQRAGDLPVAIEGLPSESENFGASAASLSRSSEGVVQRSPSGFDASSSSSLSTAALYLQGETIEERERRVGETKWGEYDPYTIVESLGVAVDDTTNFDVAFSPEWEEFRLLPLLRSSPFLLKTCQKGRAQADDYEGLQYSKQYYLRQVNHRIVSQQMTPELALMDVFVHSFLPLYFGLESPFLSVLRPAVFRPKRSAEANRKGQRQREKKSQNNSPFSEEVRETLEAVSHHSTIDPREFELVAPPELLPLSSTISYPFAATSGLDDHEEFLRKVGMPLETECTIEYTMRMFYELVFARDPDEEGE